MGSVNITNWSISILDLTRMVHNHSVSNEVLSISWRIVLGVSSNKSSLDILDRENLYVESNFVSWGASGTDSWCFLMDLRSADTPFGAKVMMIPGLRAPVSTLQTGTVTIPPTCKRLEVELSVV